MSVRDTTVRLYRSTDSDAPVLSGQSGALIAVLDACLAGYGQVSVSSLAVADGVATAVVAGGHGCVNLGDTVGVDVGVVVRVGGITGDLAGLNRDWRATVVSATHLTWDCEAIPEGSASGTITLMRAPLDAWSKTFSGANKGAYRSISPYATGLYLRIDDGGAEPCMAVVRGYEAMTDVDTGTGPFPTVGQQASPGWAKSETANGVARPWVLVGDHRTLWILIKNGPTYPAAWSIWAFGDLAAFAASDPWACGLYYGRAVAGLRYTAGSSYTYGHRGAVTSYSGYALARAAGQATEGATGGYVQTPLFGANGIGHGVLASPNPTDGRDWYSRTLIADAEADRPRGLWRGLIEKLTLATATGQPAWLAIIPDVSDCPPQMVALPYWAGDAGIYRTVLIDAEGPW